MSVFSKIVSFILVSVYSLFPNGCLYSFMCFHIISSVFPGIHPSTMFHIFLGFSNNTTL